MKRIILLSVLFFSTVTLFSQPSEMLNKIITQLESCYREKPLEKVIIQTDKSIYQPSEKVWFSAWIWNSSSAVPSVAGTEMLVKLFSSDGKALFSDKYLLNSGIVCGDLLLPDDVEPGNYFLCALLPGQTDVNTVPFQKITVCPVYANSLLISVSAENEVMKKDADNIIRISVKELDGKPAKGQRLEYRVTCGKNIVGEGILKADASGLALYHFRIPENADGTPFTFSVSGNRNATVKTVRLVSETDQVKIVFYPEGGTLIPGVPFKTGFYATDRQGNPVDLEGEVRDATNEPVVKVKTFSKGFGLCPFQASEGNKYTLYLTSGIGKGQKFNLPPVNAKGSAMTLVKTDNEYLWFNVIFADRQQHNIAVTASQKGKVYWASDLRINGQNGLKIPVNELPQGLVLISSFSDEGFLLNQRLVSINKNEELKIKLSAGSEKIKEGEGLDFDIRLSDESGKPLPGTVFISVSDKVRNQNRKAILPVEWYYNTMLKNKVSTDETRYREDFDRQGTFDYFMIANELRDCNPDANTFFNPGKPKIEIINPDKKFSFSEEFEKKLGEKVTELDCPEYISDQVEFPDDYFSVNKGLIFFKRKVTPEVQKSDSYKRLLETGSSIIQTLQSIKPFSMEGNKIIFPGGHNSLMAQGGALIVIDGQQKGEDASVLNSVSPYDVESIRVSTSAVEIQRYSGFNSVGLIEITTKKGGDSTANVTQKEMIYNGVYRVPRDFELPGGKKKPATTVFWNGKTIIDSSGKINFHIPRINVASGFIITVEGTDGNGRFGHATEQIEVTQ